MMKVLLISGSPRSNGNTSTALDQIRRGIEANIPGAAVQQLDVCQWKLSGCTNCNACKENGGVCVTPDDSAKIIQQIYDSQVIVLATPVYFWGMTSQLKMVVDKLYSKEEQLRRQKKKLGIVAIGAADLDDPQYKLIGGQFECICDFLGWSVIFNQGICASEAGDLAGDKARLQELNELWKSV